jgi:hypothetical protein
MIGAKGLDGHPGSYGDPITRVQGVNHVVISGALEPGPRFDKPLQRCSNLLGTEDLGLSEILQGALGEQKRHSRSVIEMTVGQKDTVHS